MFMFFLRSSSLLRANNAPKMIWQSNKVWAQESERPGLKSHVPVYSLSNLRQVFNWSELLSPSLWWWRLRWARSLAERSEARTYVKHVAHRRTDAVTTSTFVITTDEHEDNRLTNSGQSDWPVFPQSWIGTVEGFWFWTWGGRWFSSREGKLAKSRPSWKAIFWGHISQAHKSQQDLQGFTWRPHSLWPPVRC